MRKLVRGGIAVAAAGMLAFGLAACKVSSSGSGDDGKKDSASSSLTCDDLSDQVNKNAPDDTTPISKFEPKKFDKLAGWMVDNGKNFEKKDLGKAVTEWGTDAGTYFDVKKQMSDADRKKFEDAAGTIAGNCKNIGFEIDKTQQ
ncbi:MAG TPA: hypothetical protein VE172_08510 [Stackebrandtia sp.]|jgi:hypothetical protein|uniref:hypothetical protein n=1 Tax=Stackebrandtia sp. TaxID=2023065 RepID=UPI002D2928B9|nr:hypothetical protein [Stackebrandtia sp.]HZE38842.1 hypothetical protein [Stackebrandtia sp.]